MSNTVVVYEIRQWMGRSAIIQSTHTLLVRKDRTCTRAKAHRSTAGSLTLMAASLSPCYVWILLLLITCVCLHGLFFFLPLCSTDPRGLQGWSNFCVLLWNFQQEVIVIMAVLIFLFTLWKWYVQGQGSWWGLWQPYSLHLNGKTQPSKWCSGLHKSSACPSVILQGISLL